MRNVTSFEALQTLVRRGLVLRSPIGELFYVLYALISFIGIAGNALVVYIVCFRAGMRTPRNILIANLSLANLFTSTVLMPFLCVPDVNIEWYYGDFLCVFSKMFFNINHYCISFTISAISVDRYIVVRRTDKTAGRIEKRRYAMALSLCLWAVALLLSLPHYPYITNKHYPGIPPWTNRTVLQACMTSGAPFGMRAWILAQLVLLQYSCPLLFVAFFNYKLHRFLKLRQSKRQMLKEPPRILGNVPKILVNSTEALQTERTYDSIPFTLRRSFRCFPRDWSKTSVLLFAMAASYAMLWAPFVGVQFIETFGSKELQRNSELQRYLDISMKLVGTLTVCVNPFLYGYLNANFRRAFAELICLRSCRSNRVIEHNGIERSCSANFPNDPALPQSLNVFPHRRASSVDYGTDPTDLVFSPSQDVFL